MQSIAHILKHQPLIPSGIQKQKTQQTTVKMNANSANQTTSSTCKATDSNKQRIEHLFTRFAVFYGHVWRSQFKSDGFLVFAKKEWLEGLAPFNDDTLNRAILECRDFCEMPPTLPQMIRCCREIKKRTTFYVAPKEITPASKEVAAASIKQCKAFLFK